MKATIEDPELTFCSQPPGLEGQLFTCGHGRCAAVRTYLRALAEMEIDETVSLVPAIEVWTTDGRLLTIGGSFTWQERANPFVKFNGSRIDFEVWDDLPLSERYDDVEAVSLDG